MLYDIRKYVLLDCGAFAYSIRWPLHLHMSESRLSKGVFSELWFNVIYRQKIFVRQTSVLRERAVSSDLWSIILRNDGSHATELCLWCGHALPVDGGGQISVFNVKNMALWQFCKRFLSVVRFVEFFCRWVCVWICVVYFLHLQIELGGELVFFVPQSKHLRSLISSNC